MVEQKSSSMHERHILKAGYGRSEPYTKALCMADECDLIYSKKLHECNIKTNSNLVLIQVYNIS